MIALVELFGKAQKLVRVVDAISLEGVTGLALVPRGQTDVGAVKMEMRKSFVESQPRRLSDD